MKLLRVKASHFKNCCDGFTIDLTSKSKKTAEDKEYELQEIAPDLHVFNTAAFIGKNASGKTTAIELLDCAYSILGEFRLEDKHYSYDGVQLELTFYHDGFLYLYETVLSSGKTMGNQAVFRDLQPVYPAVDDLMIPQFARPPGLSRIPGTQTGPRIKPVCVGVSYAQNSHLYCSLSPALQKAGQSI